MSDHQKTVEKATAEALQQPAPQTRNDIRSKILATHVPKREVFQFFGADIELRQPVMSDIIKAQDAESVDRGMVDTLVKYAYVPGTEEKVFDAADVDQLMTLPFGQDMMRVAKALETLTDVNFIAKKPS